MEQEKNGFFRARYLASFSDILDKISSGKKLRLWARMKMRTKASFFFHHCQFFTLTTFFKTIVQYLSVLRNWLRSNEVRDDPTNLNLANLSYCYTENFRFYIYRIYVLACLSMLWQSSPSYFMSPGVFLAEYSYSNHNRDDLDNLKDVMIFFKSQVCQV